MKNLLIYLFIIIFIIFCTSCDKKKNDLVVNARLVRTFDSIYTDSSMIKIFAIDLSIKNNSKNDYLFWTMSCSWTENWCINSDNYYFVEHDCDGNYPKLNKIKSNDSIIYHSLITKRQNSRFQNIDTTRFCFLVIDTMSCKTIMDFDNILGDRSKHDRIIWSNPLVLNKE